MPSADERIRIFGAREHNLKGVDLELPRGRLIVFTGVSGSGKSSMALDTIYAEGQRRYVESLSTYARQFFAGMTRPQVDHVDGLSPAIAIDQRSSSGNQRSIVATITDIHDYLRVLYARVGEVFCYSCGRPVKAYTPAQIVDRIMALGEGARVHILAPVERAPGQALIDLVRDARRQGFVRMRLDGEITDISSGLPGAPEGAVAVEVVVDRVVVKESARSRIADSVDTALQVGEGLLTIMPEEGEDLHLSTRFSCPECGIAYPEMTPAMFSFNSPAGMCPECDGLGTQRGLDPDRLVADPGKSILDGALEVYGDVQTRHVRHILEGLAEHYGFDLKTPWRDLSPRAREVILYGTEEPISFHARTRSGRTFEYSKRFEGLVPAGQRRYHDTGSSGQKAFYDRFFAPLPCPECGGDRLRRESRAVRVGGLTLPELIRMTAERAFEFLEALELPAPEAQLVAELLNEVRSRLRFMIEVGVGYLTLDRVAPSLAGGEPSASVGQQLGSGLAGILYILDEPSIGLHPSDHGRLLDVLETPARPGQYGNRRRARRGDDPARRLCRRLRPRSRRAGRAGDHAGDVAGLLAADGSLTGRYLSGRRVIPVPASRRKGTGDRLIVRGATHFNLRNVDVEIRSAL